LQKKKEDKVFPLIDDLFSSSDLQNLKIDISQVNQGKTPVKI
jgi:hypothetical protein